MALPYLIPQIQVLFRDLRPAVIRHMTRGPEQAPAALLTRARGSGSWL